MNNNTKALGNINVGDKLKLLPHRLLLLDKNKAVIIAENSSGWCIVDSLTYSFIKDLFKQQEIIFDNKLSNTKISLLKSLWNSDLVEKNGTHLSSIINPFTAIFLLLKITGSCNFKCTYCYDYHDSKINKTIPIDKVKNTIASILAKNRRISIAMQGGEPLLYFPLIKEIVEFTVKATGETNSVDFIIQTNGALLNKNTMSYLEKYNFSIGLSLDGMTEQANANRATKLGKTALEIFKRNINDFGKSLTKRAGVICTVGKQNIREVPSFILWLQDLGIKNVNLGPLLPTGKGEALAQDIISPLEFGDLLGTIIDMIKDHKIHSISVANITNAINSLINPKAGSICHTNPCGASNNFLVIDSEGNYRSCDCIYNDYFLLDNNDANSILDTREKILNRREHLKNNECLDCAIFGICSGGCVAEAILESRAANTLPKTSCIEKKLLYKTLLTEYSGTKRPLFKYYEKLMAAKKMDG